MMPLDFMSLIGGKQVAPPAPPFQPGSIPGSLFQGPLAGMQQSPGLDLLNNIGGQTAGTEPNNLPTESGIKPGFFDSLFGSIDQNLQSPAKLLGIGLLNQGNYPLGTLGLLGKGLFDAFKR